MCVRVCVCVCVCVCVVRAHMQRSASAGLANWYRATHPKKDTGLIEDYKRRDTNTYIADYSYTPNANGGNGEET